MVSGKRRCASLRGGSWILVLSALLAGPAWVACSDVGPPADSRAARSREPVASSQLGVFYDVAFNPAPSLAEISADHPTATAPENAATLLRELAAQAEPAWATGVMTLPALTSIGGTQLYAPTPATNRIRYTCGITLVSPSYAITAGHCVTDDSDFSALTLRLYRITPALAKSYVPAVLSGTFPSYSQPNLSASDGFLFDEYHCSVENRCYNTSNVAIDCPSVADDMALLHCEGRPGDKYGFLNVSTQGNPTGKEALMHWTHEVLDLGGPESSLPADRLTHYVNRTSDVTQNYHYFEGAADLLPLRSISWADGTPTTWVSSTAVDVHGCHGTSGSGMLVRAGTTPVYELVGPVALAGPAFGTRLCEQVPNPGGPTSGKGTSAMAGDGLNPSAFLSLHTAEIQADCHDRVGGERDVSDLPFAPGSHAVSTLFSHLTCQVDDFGADGTATAEPVLGPYPEKFVVDASGSVHAIGGFSTEANADYRLGAQVMPEAACSSGCGKLTLTAGVSTFDTSPHPSEPSTVAVTFPSPGAGNLALGAANSGQLRAFGGIVLIREGQVNSFDTLEDRLEAALYALDGAGSVLAGPLPARFAGDGKAGFEVVLRPGERVALLRQALAPGREWTLRLGAPSYADLTCGLLDRHGAPLGGVPCAELVHLDDHTGTEARLGLYVELASTSSRAEAELRTVALASDAARDGDDDGIPEVLDNCPGAWNPSQGSCNEVPPGSGGTGGMTGESGFGGEGGEATSGGTGGTGAGSNGGEGGEPTVSSGGSSGASSDAGASGAAEAGTGPARAGASGSSSAGAGSGAGGSAGELTTAGFSGGGASGGSGPNPQPPVASTKEKSGCGCRVGGEGALPSFAWLGTAVAAAALGLRRRRSLRA